jgi:Fe-S cluster assembly ATPase SufC
MSAMEGSGCSKLFSFPEDQLHLHDAALDLILAVSNLQIVAIMGDGRAGKSHLGNEILGQQAFKTSNGGDAMTHGVDIAMQGNNLLMDC